MHVTLSLFAVIVTLLGPLGLAVSAAPVTGRPVLVIVPPWVDPHAIIVRAGGQVIFPVRAPLAAMAFGDDPNFIPRLKQHGAWAVRDGSRLDLFCGGLS